MLVKLMVNCVLSALEFLCFGLCRVNSQSLELLTLRRGDQLQFHFEICLVVLAVSEMMLFLFVLEDSYREFPTNRIIFQNL